LRSRFLDNSFDLYVALDTTNKQYSAKGTILTLDSFDDQNVYDNCITNYKDCIGNVLVQGSTVDNNVQSTTKQ
jgi:hypothetical protein